VNTDNSAPIKEFSDVFIHGDLFDVAPKLKAILEKGVEPAPARSAGTDEAEDGAREGAKEASA
jgi:hypothetical protein